MSGSSARQRHMLLLGAILGVLSLLIVSSSTRAEPSALDEAPPSKQEKLDTDKPKEKKAVTVPAGTVMMVNLFETFKLPISGAIADFRIAQNDGGTELNLHYRYTPNMLGRFLRGYTDKQMRQGIGGMAKALQAESERIHAA